MILKSFVLYALMAYALSSARTAPEGSAPPQAPEQTPGNSGGELKALVAEALANNPGLKAAELQVEAIHASPSHTWSLEAPEAGVEFFHAPIGAFPNPLDEQREIDYSVQQSIPFPGKIRSRIEAEHRHALMGEADLRSLRLDLIRDVKAAYHKLRFLDRRLEINRENRDLMKRFEEIARRQYEVGLGGQSDILRAQTELSTLRNDSLTLSLDRKEAEGMLNEMLDREIGASIEAGGAVRDAAPPDKAVLALERLKPLIERNHPGLEEARAEIAMREAQATAAKKEYLPDFMVKGAYKDMLRNGDGMGAPRDGWSVMIGMKLPFAPWSLPAYRAGTRQSDLETRQAKQRLAAMENRYLAQAQGALARMNRARGQVDLYRNVVIPQARQTLESSQAAYQAGKRDFLTLLDAYRMLFLAREEYEGAVMRLATNEAELERAVGLDLDDIKADAAGGGAE